MGGHDLLEGVGMNRNQAACEHAPILYSGTSVHPAIDDSDALTLVIDNNAVPSARIVIDLYFALGY